MAGMRIERRAAGLPGEQAVNAEIRRLVRAALAPQVALEASTASGHPSEYTLATYLEGRLQGAAEEAFERHVAHCSACAEELVLARRAGIGEAPSYGRKLWKIAAAMAIVLAGLVAALLAAGAVGGRIQSTVVASVRDALGAKARIEDAAIHLSGGPSVDIKGLSVADPGGGGQPMIAAPSATWKLDYAQLARGRVTGALELRGPIINVVREPSGALNIDAILPSAGNGREDLLARARRQAVDAVEITSGTLRLVDRSGDARRELRMAAVDASIRNLSGESPAHVSARAGVESTRQNLSLRGEVGPWGEGEKPAYRFSEVALDTVPLRNLPGIGGAMRGGLSFNGALASAGDRWAEISSGISGRGDLRVVSGSIAGRNVVRDVIAPLLAEGSGERPLPTGLASLAATDETVFGEMYGPVEIASSHVTANDFFASSNGFTVAGKGSVGLAGDVEFQGQLTASEAATREILAYAPGAGSLVDEHGEIAIPFRLSGTWPDAKVSVDVEKLAARTLLRRGLASLFSWLAG
jgi:hypothetical protein